MRKEKEEALIVYSMILGTLAGFIGNIAASYLWESFDIKNIIGPIAIIIIIFMALVSYRIKKLI